MKQLLQSLKDGRTEVAEVPAPMARSHHVLIRTRASLVSAGTERMLVAFGKAGPIAKARQHPEKLAQVLHKARTDGLAETWGAVRAKLDQPLAPGYCNVGTVIDSRMPGFEPGMRVASNGPHAQIVSVPGRLCAPVPDGVSDEAAAFTVLGAIGLQGIRLAESTLGEVVAVTGLGLVGLLIVQMLRAQGAHVLGIDPDPARRALAEGFGATVATPGESAWAAAETLSRARGLDAVLIAASSPSDAIISEAARMARKRGRIVLVGVVGLDLNRADFYEKELSFQVSCSYGPGRYDPAYEAGGQDYPVGFVRWTAQRNFEAVLDLMARGSLDVAPLITHRFAIDDGARAMALLTSDAPSLGILLDYPGPETGETTIARLVTRGGPASASGSAGGGKAGSAEAAMTTGPGAPDGQTATPGGAQAGREGRIVVLGAGDYAGRRLLPAFAAAGAGMQTIVSARGVSATHLGRRFGFANVSTDPDAALRDPQADTAVIVTRHDAHAAQVLAALRAGKHVFCEKPLCLTRVDLDAIEAEARFRPEQTLMLGFNRRFAPMVMRMAGLLAQVDAPRALTATVNAGTVPADHWSRDRAVGGGRILGEACHFIDLLRHLAGHPVIAAEAVPLGDGVDDSAVITLRFADGSLGTIQYLANGHRSLPKERIEVFAAGRVLRLDNFRRLHGWGWGGGSAGQRAWRQDKGQTACVAAFLTAVRTGGPAPIALDEILEVSRLSIEMAERVAGPG